MYRCAASVNFRLAKIFTKKLGKKVTKPYDYQASFHELLSAEIIILSSWSTLCFLFNQMLCIVHQKITKNLMPEKSYLPKPRQKLTPEKPNTFANTFVTIFLGRFSLEAINFIFPG